MIGISGLDALRNVKNNPYRHWNNTKSSAERSGNARDASNRIFSGFANVVPSYSGPRFPRSAKVWAMGSCFAREVEHALMRRGGNVVSIDDSINIPAFQDATGRVRAGWFHRYTPRSMLQEMEWPFGRRPEWSDEVLLQRCPNDRFIDLNYPNIAGPTSREVIATRRTIAAGLTRHVADADIIILTLGLVEEWTHTPTGLVVNAMNGRAISDADNAYFIGRAKYHEVLESLQAIYNLLMEVHATKAFQLFVTVSPVPFSATFFKDDVIVANSTSKATLRASAMDFSESQDNVHYFPSYEMVTYSDPGTAWRPDAIHVEPNMVRHIVNTFVAAVYEPDALPQPG